MDWFNWSKTKFGEKLNKPASVKFDTIIGTIKFNFKGKNVASVIFLKNILYWFEQ